MRVKHVHRKLDYSPEKVAERMSLRDKLQRERPTMAQLLASGEYEEPIPLEEYIEFRKAAYALKKER